MAAAAASPDRLKKNASRGILWSMSGNIGVSAIRFISTMVLARLLAPEEFGIIGMATLFTGFIMLFGNLGMSAALIQLKEIDEEYMSTAFWTNMACGAVLFLATVIFSPLAAEFFHEPRVKPVLIILATNYIFSAMALTHVTLFYRELKFKEMALVEIILSVVRVVLIIVLALAGWGFWSLVWGNVAERVLKTIVVIALRSWWWPKFVFSREKFHRLFHFGKNIYGQSFIGYFLENIDFIIVGRVLGAQSLAFYQFAYNLPHLVLSHINSSVDNVTFPVFSKLQDDKESLARGFFKIVKFISLVTFPLMGGLCVVAPDFIVTMYGSKWVAAIIPLQILCLSGALRSITVSVNPVLHAIGRPDITLKCSFLFLPITLLLVWGGSRWGTVGIAWAMVLGAVLSLILVKIGTNLTHSHMRYFWSSIGPAFIGTFLMAGILLFIDQTHFLSGLYPWSRLLINVVIGGVLYAVSIRFIFKKDFFEFLDFVKNMIKK